MESTIHRAESRGKSDFAWLKSRHSFSFANYYNPERIHFGVLRVLNDDRIDAGTGFPSHPHDNMEIISIPLEGNLEHKDDMGNASVIKQGEIQVMSAGTGVIHSEINGSKKDACSFLQIWVIPNKKNVTPRYQQINYHEKLVMNQFNQVLSPNVDDEGVWIHQNAWFSIGEFDENQNVTYELNDGENGVYLFLLEGSLEIAGDNLSKRDAVGIWDAKKVNFKTQSYSKVLLMELPMELK